jgi:hypothetical protein
MNQETVLLMLALAFSPSWMRGLDIAGKSEDNQDCKKDAPTF